MAQLSTDTLAYAQIVNAVQNFISQYVENKNVTPKDFDIAYQNLLSMIRKSISGPMAQLDFLNKGEIPSSLRFNEFVRRITDDVNLINHQFDSLAANYVNSFNLIHDDIESEKSSMQRIRSKIGALELYSGSTSNNITYFGDQLTNMDLIDVNKSTNVSVCDVTDGIATLPKKEIKKWRSTISVYNKNFNDVDAQKNNNILGVSNGLAGCNFLYSDIPDKPFLFQKDSTVIKSEPSRMIDDSPVSFFEYEAISLDKGDRPNYEFKYSSGSDSIDWSSFDSKKPLKLTVELSSSSSSGDYINYISILPFFGYDAIELNAQIKNIKVTSIKLHNTNSTNAPLEILSEGPAFIGADISGANISNYKNYSYSKGVFRFPETLANRVYITFEQPSFKDVKIKHAYWKPYASANYQTATGPVETWHGQTRFNPEAAGILPQGSSSIKWDTSAIISPIESPNKTKSSSNNSVKIDLSYLTTSTISTSAIELSKGQESVYFYNKQTVGNVQFYLFTRSASININESLLDGIKKDLVNYADYAPCVFLENNQTIDDKKIDIEKLSISAGPSQTITIVCAEKHLLTPNSYTFLNGTIANAAFNGVYTVNSVSNDYTFTVTNHNTEVLPQLSLVDARTLLCYPCYTKVTSTNIDLKKVNKNQNKTNTETIWLNREYEYIPAKRASLGIRDIYVGKETYVELAEIISKPFYINNDIDLLSLEVSEYVPQSDDSSTSIDYYISVDDGLKWIQISPMKKNFTGIPEILSFNQNLNNSNTLPQIAYYNSPEVPNPIKSIRFRAVMKKTKTGNLTPVLGSYKIGVRFK